MESTIPVPILQRSEGVHVKKANGSKDTHGSMAQSRPRKEKHQNAAHDAKYQAEAPVATTRNGQVHLEPRS